MNRLVLIGNGFDLAHGLKTSYADFIEWYWDKRVLKMSKTYAKESTDSLCSFKYLGEGHMLSFFFDHPAVSMEKGYGKEFIESILDSNMFETKFSPFFKNICTSIETKGWVDIENEYYELLKLTTLPHPGVAISKDLTLINLNEQLQYLQELLVKYLLEISEQELDVNEGIRRALYAPINSDDVAVEGKKRWTEYVMSEMNKEERKLEFKASDYGIGSAYRFEIQDFNNHPWDIKTKDYPHLARLPEQIMLLNFNYTNTPERYLNRDVATIVPIHGKLDDPESVIFGYGDEIDPSFKELRDLNNGECLKNVKSMRYLETPNYRNVLSFIESAPFQVLIMGHSCGISDRTLLNTIFEHRNCISIKPYFYQKEDGSNNYTELIQNISRNFNDMKLMRDRVVNKTQCEPLVKN